MKEAGERLSALYEARFGEKPELEAIAASGSGRHYFRLRPDGASGTPELPTVIGTVGTDVKENEDFLTLQAAMMADGTKVPEVLAVSEDRLMYLQSDLGDTSLFSLLGTSQTEALMARAIRALARLQTGIRTVGTAALVRPPFDRRLALWDLNYFKYCFLKPMEVPFDEWRLEEDLQLMATRLTGCDTRLWGFMYRDCQSRNIMVTNGELYWIDFQGGRPGPMAYDVASLLWQARAGFSMDFRSRLTAVYAREVSLVRDISAQEVEKAVYDIVPLRVLQTLGAYGFRGLTQRKEHFLKSIPAAVESLYSLGERGVLNAYPELLKIANSLWKKIQMAL